MVVKEQDRQVISTLIGGTVLGTGWFLIRLITTKATGQLDWNLVLFMAHFGIYVGLVFAPFWAKNLFRSLITLGAATIVVSVPVHYQVFSSAIARLDPIWPCFDTLVFFGEIVALAVSIGYVWYLTLGRYGLQEKRAAP